MLCMCPREINSKTVMHHVLTLGGNTACDFRFSYVVMNVINFEQDGRLVLDSLVDRFAVLASRCMSRILNFQEHHCWTGREQLLTIASCTRGHEPVRGMHESLSSSRAVRAIPNDSSQK